MQSYWVSFAATGKPKAEGWPQWPLYDATSKPYVEFGDSVQVRHDVCATQAAACDLFGRIMDDER